MIKLFLSQVVVLFGICVILDWLRQLINKFYKNNFRLRLIDSVPVLGLFFIHQLTMNYSGISWDSILIIIWMFMGVLILIHKTFVKHQLSHKNFYLTLWRIGDIYLLMAWLISGIVNII